MFVAVILSGCPTVQQYTEKVVESKVDVDVLFDKLLMGTTGMQASCQCCV